MCLLAFLLVSQIQEGADDMDPSSHGGERLISVVTGSPVVDELALRKTFLTEQQYVALKMWSFIWMSFLLSRIIVHDFDGAVKELG